MKSLILIIVFFTYGLYTNAQVADSLIYKQLNLTGYRAQRMAGVGATLTITGIMAMGAGIIIDHDYEGADKPLTGLIIAETGACLFAVGIPVWIIEVSKMNRIEIEMIRYGGQARALGVGLKFRF
jgi:hypothetical protein